MIEGGDVRASAGALRAALPADACATSRGSCSVASCSAPSEVLACAAHPVFHFGEQSGIEAARRVYRAVRGRRRPDDFAGELGRIARDAPRLVPVAYRRVAHGRAARCARAGDAAPTPSRRRTPTAA